jgi:hypothetical protein
VRRRGDIESRQATSVLSPRVLLLLRSPFGPPPQQQRERYPWRRFHLIPGWKLCSAWGQSKGSWMLGQRQILSMLTHYGLAQLAKRLHRPRSTAQTDNALGRAILALNLDTPHLLSLLQRSDLQGICDYSGLIPCRRDKETLIACVLNPEHHEGASGAASDARQGAVGQHITVEKGEILDDIVASRRCEDMAEAERLYLSFDHEDLTKSEAYWGRIRGFRVTDRVSQARAKPRI